MGPTLPGPRPTTGDPRPQPTSFRPCLWPRGDLEASLTSPGSRDGEGLDSAPVALPAPSATGIARGESLGQPALLSAFASSNVLMLLALASAIASSIAVNLPLFGSGKPSSTDKACCLVSLLAICVTSSAKLVAT